MLHRLRSAKDIRGLRAHVRSPLSAQLPSLWHSVLQTLGTLACPNSHVSLFNSVRPLDCVWVPRPAPHSRNSFHAENWGKVWAHLFLFSQSWVAYCPMSENSCLMVSVADYNRFRLQQSKSMTMNCLTCLVIFYGEFTFCYTSSLGIMRVSTEKAFLHAGFVPGWEQRGTSDRGPRLNFRSSNLQVALFGVANKCIYPQVNITFGF